jgi:hypothetical protein
MKLFHIDDVFAARKLRHSFLDNSPVYSGFRDFQRDNGWETDLSDDALAEVVSALEGRLKSPFESSTHSDYEVLTHFLINLEESVFGWHQINRWRELMIPYNKSEIHQKMQEMLSCIETLRKACVPDYIFMIPMFTIEVSSHELYTEAVRGLDTLEAGILNRKKSIAKDAKKPQSARRLIARHVAHCLGKGKVEPSRSENGALVRILQVVLS